MNGEISGQDAKRSKFADSNSVVRKKIIAFPNKNKKRERKKKK